MHILWLKTELLHPVDKGGKIRTYSMLRELRNKHRITYLTLDDGTAGQDAIEEAQEYCHELIRVPHRNSRKFSRGFYLELLRNLRSSLPYAISRYQSDEMRRAIDRHAVRHRPDVIVSDFLTPSINMSRALRCPSVLFQHNVEALIWKRSYELQKDPVKRAYLHGQWQRMRSFEGRMCRVFPQVVTVSPEDREMIKQQYSVEAVVDIPTGVDLAHFHPRREGEADPYHLVFTGSMDWLPNVDAILCFVKDILPLIRRRVPEVHLTIVGRDPDPRVAELARRERSVLVTGRVPDVRPYLERAAAVIVPIRIGGGTRLKVFEALAMEKPVVSTRIGAEGLPVRNGVELLLAETAGEFADAVLRVLLHPDEARQLGQRGGELVRARFGWDRVADLFAGVCERAVLEHQRSGEAR
jgi:sugar transferase (PEP-CTERM/EpsH1 system associated)